MTDNSNNVSHNNCIWCDGCGCVDENMFQKQYEQSTVTLCSDCVEELRKSLIDYLEKC